MKVLICGGRNFNNWKYVSSELDKLGLVPLADLIIHGGARGADAAADVYARDRSIACLRMPADWSQGKSAGILRNRCMLTYGPDLVVAFPGGPGTADMVAISKKAGIEVLELQPTQEQLSRLFAQPYIPPSRS